MEQHPGMLKVLHYMGQNHEIDRCVCSSDCGTIELLDRQALCSALLYGSF
jgi:hypothetical protein